MVINNQFIQLANWDKYPELVNTCGAFCIKYWQWHSGLEDFRTVNQQDAILDVYKRIKFGSSAENFNLNPGHSNPFLMCRECSGSYMYYDARNEQFASLAKPMCELFPDVRVREENLKLGLGRYAILVVGDHYILLYRSTDDEYYYHDPLKPAPMRLECDIPVLGDYIGDYRYTGAGIVLP